jgi:hypothetical protein
MEEKSGSITQIKQIKKTLLITDTVFRHSMIIIIIAIGILAIAKSYTESAVPIFVLFPPIVFFFVFVYSLFWTAKKGYEYNLLINILVDMAFGRVTDEDKEEAKKLAEQWRALFPIKSLLRPLHPYLCYRACLLKLRVYNRAIGLSHGIKTDCGEHNIISDFARNTFSMITPLLKDKEKAGRTLEQVLTLLMKNSYSLN